MRELTQKDIDFLKSVQTETKTADNGELLIENKETLNKLIILISSVNWPNINRTGMFQTAADKATEFMTEQTTVRTLENTYVYTKHPYEISKIAQLNGRIRITLAMTIPDKENGMPVTRHIGLIYETHTGAIYPG